MSTLDEMFASGLEAARPSADAGVRAAAREAVTTRVIRRRRVRAAATGIAAVAVVALASATAYGLSRGDVVPPVATPTASATPPSPTASAPVGEAVDVRFGFAGEPMTQDMFDLVNDDWTLEVLTYDSYDRGTGDPIADIGVFLSAPDGDAVGQRRLAAVFDGVPGTGLHGIGWVPSRVALVGSTDGLFALDMHDGAVADVTPAVSRGRTLTGVRGLGTGADGRAYAVITTSDAAGEPADRVMWFDPEAVRWVDVPIDADALWVRSDLSWDGSMVFGADAQGPLAVSLPDGAVTRVSADAADCDPGWWTEATTLLVRCGVRNEFDGTLAALHLDGSGAIDQLGEAVNAEEALAARGYFEVPGTDLRLVANGGDEPTVVVASTVDGMTPLWEGPSAPTIVRTGEDQYLLYGEGPAPTVVNAVSGAGTDLAWPMAEWPTSYFIAPGRP